jgi:hypothetical protein
MSSTYRDDVQAARQRREALARELAEVKHRLTEQAHLAARARELELEVAEAAYRVRQARIRSKLPLLDRITIATPCTEDWNQMSGDDRSRRCAKCEKNVYDLSEMTTKEAEALLAAKGEKPCVRIFRRPDGTVITSDCPEGKRLRRRRRVIALAAGLAIGTSVATTAALAFTQGECAPVMGAMEVVQPTAPISAPAPTPARNEPLGR